MIMMFLMNLMYYLSNVGLNSAVVLQRSILITILLIILLIDRLSIHMIMKHHMEYMK